METVKLHRPQFVAPILHLILFSVMVLAASKPDGADLRGGVAFFSFAALWLLDFPVSVIPSGMLWSAAEAERSLAPGLVLWAILGSTWWFFLGMSIEAWMKRFRRKPQTSQ
jgi:hypothetical protein